MTMIIEEFWKSFIDKNKLPCSTSYISSLHFELTEKWANELLRLVLIGQKKATSSAYISFELENERVPEAGDYSIVTDWLGVPRCVIKTTAVKVLPYKDITLEICSREGEDDSLESWRKGHERFFIEDGKELGYKFSDELLVLFEDFEVVFKDEEYYKKIKEGI